MESLGQAWANNNLALHNQGPWGAGASREGAQRAVVASLLKNILSMHPGSSGHGGGGVVCGCCANIGKPISLTAGKLCYPRLHISRCQSLKTSLHHSGTLCFVAPEILTRCLL